MAAESEKLKGQEMETAEKNMLYHPNKSTKSKLNKNL
jgi:hypothetical protein